jgi:hypothetical protein
MSKLGAYRSVSGLSSGLSGFAPPINAVRPLTPKGREEEGYVGPTPTPERLNLSVLTLRPILQARYKDLDVVYQPGHPQGEILLREGLSERPVARLTGVGFFKRLRTWLSQLRHWGQLSIGSVISERA